MALCESAIDAASCAVLYPEYTAISTSGATAEPVWLQNFIANGCDIYCGFDADETGDIMANKMIEQYPSIKRLLILPKQCQVSIKKALNITCQKQDKWEKKKSKRIKSKENTSLKNH